jgi:hypothetical protein
MMLATIPPLWFWIMDPKIDDLSKEANLADALT